MREEHDIALKVAQRLRELRAAKSLSLRQLALRSGVTPEMASRAERGLRSPRIETLAKLCNGLGVDLPAFFAFDRTPRRDLNRGLERLHRALAQLVPAARPRAISALEEVISAAGQRRRSN